MTARLFFGVLLATSVALGAQPTGRAPRNADEFDTLFQQVKNGGRWGPNDELGSVNLITPAKRKAAAGLIKTGETVSLAPNPLTQEDDRNTRPFQHTSCA